MSAKRKKKWSTNGMGLNGKEKIWRQPIPVSEGSHKKSWKYSFLKESSNNTCDAHQVGCATMKLNTINHLLENQEYNTYMETFDNFFHSQIASDLKL